MRSPIEVVAPARLGTPFRWLLGATWVSNIGDGFAIAAGPLLVASQTHDPFLVALAALAQWLPPFVFGLWAGVLSDRMDRKTLIVTVDLGPWCSPSSSSTSRSAPPGRSWCCTRRCDWGWERSASAC